MLRPARSIPITCAPWGTGDGGDERSSTPVPPPYQWPLGGRGLCMHQSGDRNRSDATGGGEGTVLSVTLMWPDPFCEDRAEVSSEREEPGSRRSTEECKAISRPERHAALLLSHDHRIALCRPWSTVWARRCRRRRPRHRHDMQIHCSLQKLHRQARWRHGQWE